MKGTKGDGRDGREGGDSCGWRLSFRRRFGSVVEIHFLQESSVTEQRRERLRVGWVHAGPVAGLLVYLAASGVHALAPVTAMVTSVQVLWLLFGVGMFLHALWGTEERSWIPRAGGLIVAVGVMAAWEIGGGVAAEALGIPIE
jgi:hypothetical protein